MTFSAVIMGGKPRDSFPKVKSTLISGETLCAFNPTPETIVSADASSFGLRVVLRHRQPEDKALHPVSCIL